MAEQKDNKEWLAWAFRTVMALLMGVGAWFAKSVDNRIVTMERSLEPRVAELEARQRVGDATNFSLAAQAALQKSLTDLDKRLSKNEDAMDGVAGSLRRIESRLDAVTDRSVRAGGLANDGGG